MYDHFLDPSMSNTETSKAECRRRLRDNIITEWEIQISNEEGKLMFSRQIKKSLKLEPYLLHINNLALLKIITPFCGSDHTLEIVIGRHRKLEVADRMCQICKNDVETELHFFQSCPKYSEHRKRYLNALNTQNWIDMLQCNDKNVALNVANFLDKAMKIIIKYNWIYV